MILYCIKASGETVKNLKGNKHNFVMILYCTKASGETVSDPEGTWHNLALIAEKRNTFQVIYL